MKKRFTLILASMLLTMGAWAQEWSYSKTVSVGEQITDLSTVAEGQTVAFKLVSGNSFITLNLECEAGMSGQATGLSVFKLHRVGKATNEFTIESAREGYYFPNIGNSGWPKYYMTNEGEPQAFQFLTSKAGESTLLSEGQFVIKSSTTDAYFDGSSSDFTGWQGKGANCVYEVYSVSPSEDKYTFEELSYSVTDEAGTVYEGTYDGFAELSEPTFTGAAGYSLTNKSWNGKTFSADITFPVPVSQKVMINPFSGYAHWYYVSDTDVKVTKTAPTAETVNNYLWVIEPALTEGKFTFAIKNVATEKYMSSASNTDQHAQGVVTVSETGTQFTLEGSNQFKIQDKYLSTNSSTTADQFAGTWGSHNGTKNNVYVADHISYTLTDNAGNTFEGSCEGYARVDEPTLTGAHGYTLSNASWTNGNHFAATITFPYPVSKVDGATNATLLSSYYNAKQWHAVNENVLVQTAGANLAELDYWMWAIYPAFNDGAFTFTIKNIATGLFVTANKTGSNLDTSNNNNTGADGAVTLTETGTAFSIPSERDFAFTIGDVTAYLSINSDRDTDVNLGVHTGAHGGTNVLTPSFAQLEKYQVTIGSTGYSTLYTPIKVAVPEGVTAYTGELNGEWLTLTEVENVIPANTAVVLQGTANTYTFSASSAEAAEIENNALTGSTETVATSSVEGTVYTLQSNGEGGVVFKKYTGANLTGFKAYLLDLSTEAAAIGIRFENGTTAIDNVQLSTDNVVIYDLSGRRVEKMEKGIYIVNGKKVVK